MSEPDSGFEAGGSVCRDFLRNVCNRGNKCKFKHPPDSVIVKKEGLQDKVMFCHDFQNGRCGRSNCKFIHCPKDAEQEFQSSGYLPPMVRDQVINKGVAADFAAVKGGVPVCKDFLQGKCSRRSRCKFRHVGSREYDLEMGNNQYNKGPPPQNLANSFFEEDDLFERRGPVHNDRKRRILETGLGLEVGPPPQAFFMIQEENCQLKGRVQELEKKVSDLLATNEFLLDQNAQLRMGGAGPPPAPRPMFNRIM